MSDFRIHGDPEPESTWVHCETHSLYYSESDTDECPACENESELKKARAIIRLVIPNCDWLHHEKKHQHHAFDECPVQKIIEEYDFDPDGTIARNEEPK